jgi:hypothetical protein
MKEKNLVLQKYKWDKETISKLYLMSLVDGDSENWVANIYPEGWLGNYIDMYFGCYASQKVIDVVFNDANERDANEQVLLAGFFAAGCVITIRTKELGEYKLTSKKLKRALTFWFKESNVFDYEEFSIEDLREGEADEIMQIALFGKIRYRKD